MNPKRILVDPPRHPRPETLALPPQLRLGTLMSIHTSAYATVAVAGAQGRGVEVCSKIHESRLENNEHCEKHR